MIVAFYKKGAITARSDMTMSETGSKTVDTTGNINSRNQKVFISEQVMLQSQMRCRAESAVDHVRKTATSQVAPSLTTTALQNTGFVDPGKGAAQLAIDEYQAVDQHLEIITIAQVFNIKFYCGSNVPIVFTRDDPNQTMDNGCTR